MKMGQINNKKIRLFRCPFCGGRPEIRHGGFTFMATIACTKCGAEVKKIDEYDAVGKAVDGWNARVGKVEG